MSTIVFPIIAVRLATLWQRDRHTSADHTRLVAQTPSTISPPIRKEPSMSTLMAAQSLVQSLLLSPLAAGLAAVALGMTID